MRITNDFEASGDPVALRSEPTPPAGLIGTLVIELAGETALFDANDRLEFIADTNAIVPKPASLLMPALGGIGLRTHRP